ncbi:FAD-dependent oxidoreductase [Desulfofundulus thermosubterraneus]|uniref:Heterodisulfide reductase subunit A n=1 Tax=Desulfofundulus thermosubterraneus DSM 16057 TaxID=1121432 RepID=A0A1M6JML2_9FIRM|nr:FAD-dependent oxidoreductase [Desulfofundulus thermosubterraneus]SHJ47947.1 heterodisulfide reductase subunit A [Desulfofundulus thermosubterraneus DSM 16057]
MNYDVLVLGSGIGGMESALKLGDMGYKVLLVEKEASVGGKMILLSKVFPTLDCASCISTPKMAATVHHPNIEVMIYSEVEEIRKLPNGKFSVKVRQKPTFVKQTLCTGCRQCEMTCSVAVPDQFNFDMVARRAAYIPFPQAVPKKAVIEREGTSPCSFTCPAGIKAHGYIALVRSGKFREAFDLVLENTPLVGSLGRACYAPCEGECTRGSLEGPLPIRRIKRFIADRYYQEHTGPQYTPPEEVKDKKVAVVGAGPAGLTAAFFLAGKGYRVTIFEAGSQPGGMLRTAIPSFRLPKDVVDRDIKNVTALGVEIKTGVKVENLEELKKSGFDAIFVATGATRPKKMGIEGEELDGVVNSLDFLQQVNLGRKISFEDKTVVVVGGGNVAIDAARVAVRLGAKRVIVQYRRTRAEMPAHDREITAAEREGVEFQYLSVPQKFTGRDGKLIAVESIKMELGEPDAGGRRKPRPVEGSAYKVAADMVITAVGLEPETEAFQKLLPINDNHTISVDPETLQTTVPYVFAGGDVVTGPSMIVSAVAQGRRAAFFIDRYLKGEELKGADFDYRTPVVNKEKVLVRQQSYRTLPPVGSGEILHEKPRGFAEAELPLTEEEARYSAGRCLDCGICSECRQCVVTCPAGAVDLSMREEKKEFLVNAVIISTGFQLFPAQQKPQYGYGKFKNVITGMQMDRLLAPTRPYNGVLRPSDGKVPESIAFVLCTGSRDQSVNNPLCSRVCCMYSVKHSQLIMGALPLADVTVYYIDVRAFGKGYEEFYDQARAMGANFVKGRIARIEEKEDSNLILYYEDIDNGGKLARAEHDLVVLAVGLLPNPQVQNLFAAGELELDEYLFVKEVDEDLNPGKTSIEGVFVAGTASGARDIPDSILHAGAAAAQAAAYAERVRVRR